MKKISFKKIVTTLATLSLFVSLSAKADDQDHACKVLLCMANPGGATEFAECVPPIKKLQEDLAKGKPFPVCILGQEAGSFAKPIRDRFGLCPEGTNQVTISKGNGFPAWSDQYYEDGAGDTYIYNGTKVSNCKFVGAQARKCFNTQSGGVIPETSARVCIVQSNYQGAWTNQRGTDEPLDTHAVYKDAIFLPKEKTDKAFDIYIDNKIFHRVFLDF